MEQYVIRGNPLVGEVGNREQKTRRCVLYGSNATYLFCSIENLPDVSDINVLLEAIAEIGATVDPHRPSYRADHASTIGDLSVDYEYIKNRASYYLFRRAFGKYKRAGSSASGRM